METVCLTERQWTVLTWCIKQLRKPHRHHNGGFQNRLREWETRMDATTRSIRLTTETVGRHVSDIEFIQTAIANARTGSWQSYIRDVFAGTHARFAAP